MSFTELKRVASALIDEVAHAAIKGNVASVYFLRATLLIFSFSSLLFFITPESSHNRYANVAASLAGLVLCVLAYRRSWYIPILHITGLLILALTLYAAAYAGGINAIVLIWLTTLPLMALIVGGPKIGMFWFLAVQVILFGVWLATHIGIIDSTVPKGNGLIFGIMLNWLLCLISPFMVLWLYDLLQNKRSTLIQIDNQKLDLAQQELRTLQAHKDEFIAAIGHELRTPMGVILGLNNLLQDQLKDKPEELEAAGHIRTSTLQLLDLINNILDFSQLQAGLMKMRPTAVNVVECLQTAFNQHRELAESKQIQINLHTNALEHTHFFIDPHRFEQVAGNLIKNGLQHARTKVWVSAHSSTFESKAGFTIQVHDDGPGPDPEDHPYLFNQFMDHQHLDRFCDQGAGLGLAVCKLITDLQHGQIGLRHHHGEPTCFWFTWPAALANKKPEGSSHSHGLHETSWHILLVDDYPINLKINALIVSQAFPKAVVHCVDSGVKAQEYIQNNHCDLVLIDFLMPEINGYELAEWVRSQSPPINGIILLGLTASSSQQEWDFGMQSGMSGVLTKPLNKELLQKTVQQLFKTTPALHGPTAT